MRYKNIDDIKQKYNFLNYSEDKFNKILEKIEQVVDKNSSDFYDKVIGIFNRYIVKQLDKNKLDMVLDYICLNIKFNNDDNFASLKKLSDFFDELDYLPSFDQLKNIVFSSSKLWNYLKDNIDTGIKEVSMNSITKLTDDDIILLIIQAFYKLNKINVINIDSEDSYLTIDSTKRCMKEYSQYKILTHEEERELFLRLQNGDNKAREDIIKSNLKLVVRIAKRYIWSGYGFNDLIDEGVIGLIEATKSFDLSRNTKFSTYATHYIKKQIISSINYKSRPIRLPVFLIQEIEQLKLIEKELHLLGKEATTEELASAMKLPLKKVENIINASSINTIISDYISDESGGQISVLESIADENIKFEDEVINDIFNSELINFLKSNGIKDRELYVFCCRCGLLENGKVLFKDIAKELGITYQGAQFIYKRAVEKIGQIEGIETFMGVNKRKHI